MHLALQTISYMAERVVGHGSFGTVFQVCCWTNQYYLVHKCVKLSTRLSGNS
jgi:hypothetical protein